MATKNESHNGHSAARSINQKLNPKFSSKFNNRLNGANHKSMKIESFSVRGQNKINEALTLLSKFTKQYSKVSQQYVKVNPVKSFSLAVSFGFFAGSLFTLFLKRQRPQ